MFEKKKDKTDDTRGWFSLDDMAAAFGITSQAFAKSVRPLLGEADVKNDGQKGVRIRCRAAIDAWATKQAEKAAEAAAKKSDPLLVGADSPALELYRQHRAGLAQIELQQKQRTHVNITDLNTTLNRFASLIRHAGEVLQRRFGNDASDILNQAIDQAEETLNKEMSNGNANGKP